MEFPPVVLCALEPIREPIAAATVGISTVRQGVTTTCISSPIQGVGATQPAAESPRSRRVWPYNGPSAASSLLSGFLSNTLRRSSLHPARCRPNAAREWFSDRLLATLREMRALCARLRNAALGDSQPTAQAGRRRSAARCASARACRESTGCRTAAARPGAARTSALAWRSSRRPASRSPDRTAGRS